jgi:predicted RNase H-like HicB family nuclease
MIRSTRHAAHPAQELFTVKSYVFRVVVEADVQEDGSPAFHGYCPALPGCHTWGHTQAEALARVQEAVSLYVEDLLETGKSVPVNSELGVTKYAAPSVVVKL